MKQALVLAVAVASLAIVAAGCGGGNEQPSSSSTSPADAWATDFCTAITSWKDEIQSIVDELGTPSSLTKEGLQNAADEAKSATDNLVEDLQGLGAPDTESGQAVKDSIDELSTTLDDELSKIETAAKGVSGLTDLPGAISSITASLSAMGAAFSSTMQTIDEADPQGELKTALDDSPACADITS